jgi:hypothetical protein
MADMEILQKAVNAEAGSERFDAFIDAGFADIVWRCRQRDCAGKPVEPDSN